MAHKVGRLFGVAFLVVLGALACSGSAIESDAAPERDGGLDGTADLDVTGDAVDVSFLDVGKDWAVDRIQPDGDVLDQVGESDTPMNCQAPYAEWLCPCVSPDDCASGYCVPAANGKVCSKPCTDQCGAPGWECSEVSATCPDCQYVCVYRFARLCQPCTADAECQSQIATLDARCVAYEDGQGLVGNFCGAPCDALGDCPESYDCREVPLPTGGSLKQCVLSSGTCLCSTASIDTKAATTCTVRTETGECPGNRHCDTDGLSLCDAPIPSAEACNGKDDDCNGQTDDDVAATACLVLNEFGSCPGTSTCDGGVAGCEGAPAQKELCNGEDDDCNGQTDETFTDTDLDGLANCVDPDDDNDGVFDDGDGSGVAGDDPCLPGQPAGCDDSCPLTPSAGQEDFDLDGKGDACDKDADGDGFAGAQHAGGDDCDDLNPAIHPGVPEGQPAVGQCEYCNGRDDDCDGVTDEGCYDTDADGWINCLSPDDDGDGVCDNGGPMGANGVTYCVPGPTGEDNCRLVPNTDQADLDADGAGDACDPDLDGDAIENEVDDCPYDYNPDQLDNDLDGLGDTCDPDDDDDGIPDTFEGATDPLDNCRFVPNPDQLDTDGDDMGDACDADDDNDGVLDGADNCPLAANTDQLDTDLDGLGDACDPDDDGDDVLDGDDNCPLVANTDQVDADVDGPGDACDPDDDNDGVPDDGNADGVVGTSLCVGGATTGCDDNCRTVPNPGQAELDQDGLGDACDTDQDGDGYDGVAADGADCDDRDASVHPGVDEGQTSRDDCDTCNGVDDDCDGVTDEGCFDTNGDGLIDCLAYDDDADGWPDGLDNCPVIANPTQDDLDGDKIGDACDPDQDGDGWCLDATCAISPTACRLGCADCDDRVAGTHPGAAENCNGVDDNCDSAIDEGFPDTNADGVADCVSTDDDGDGLLDDGDFSGDENDLPCAPTDVAAGLDPVPLCDDNCRTAPNPDQADFDGDGVGDACDTDDDGDDIPDVSDNCPLMPNANQRDTDGDGLGDVCDDDLDGDSVANEADNCYRVPNTDQADLDDDHIGDACDPDVDGDADPAGNDCNDRDAAIHHGATETCNGVDDNCNGAIDEAGADGCTPHYNDRDHDTFGDAADVRCLCADDGTYTASVSGDCNDNDAAISPTATEICDERIDNDCDAQTDEGCNDDGDAYCDAAMGVVGKPSYCLSGGGDCNDDDAAVRPGRDELCNEIDENCANGVDEGCDDDGDDYCDGAMTVLQVGEPLAWPTVCPKGPGDCVDAEPAINPGTTEACDGIDNDCNADVPGIGAATTKIDEGCDKDGDSFCDAAMTTVGKPLVCIGGGGDCDDTRANVHPGASSIPAGTETCDDLDNNCNGTIDDNCDKDQDGYCDQAKDVIKITADPVLWPAICPLGPGDCNDGPGTSAAAIHPNAGERCNAIDDDCDGKTDAVDAADLASTDIQPCENQRGACLGATKPAALCVNGAWNACGEAAYTAFTSAYQAGLEKSCDGVDNDCDDSTDEDFSVTLPGGQIVHGVGQACGTGACAGGVTTCRSDKSGIECPSEGNVSPEVCNGGDDDCDGLKDAADPVDLLANDTQPCENQKGVCAGATKPVSLCVNGAWQACTDTTYAAYSASYQIGVEIACDGKDNDCDGLTDEDFTVTGADGTAYTGINKACGVGKCAGGTTTCKADHSGIACSSFASASAETCNAIDDDCDGKTDAADATDLLANDPKTCEKQAGACFGSKKPASLCQGGAWGVCTAAIYETQNPDYEDGAEVSCDGKDNDCNGTKDEDFSVTTLNGQTLTGTGKTCGTGKCAGGVTQCNVPGTGLVCSTEYLSASEVCNSVDDDCDGKTDAADASDLWKYDLRYCENQSGVCNGATKPASLCQTGSWTVCTATVYQLYDSAYEAGDEVSCDGKDNNCSGQIDESFSLVLKNGVTVKGINQSCGTGKCAGGVTVCNANKNGIACPSEANASNELCNSVDDDCDGLTDANDAADLLTYDKKSCEKQSGVCAGATKPVSLCQFGAWGACVDSIYQAHSASYEGGTEVHCDGLDNDCSGTTDEDFSYLQLNGVTVKGAGLSCGTGKCAGGTTVCTADHLGTACPSETQAVNEVCNSVDDDCDGKTDATDPSLVVVDCENQKGVCVGAKKPAALCVSGGWQACGNAQYLANNSAFEAGTEVHCDGLDNDCSGTTDEDFSVTGADGTVYTGVAQGCGVGACTGGTTSCKTDHTGIACSSFSAATTELCNNTDDDCDGKTDATDTSLYRPACENQNGVCSGSTKPASLCSGGGWGACVNATYLAYTALFQAGTETSCDGQDNDCSGSIDEDFTMKTLNNVYVTGVNQSCGTGVCAGGKTACNAAKTGILCPSEASASTETCSNADENCDGTTDEGCDDDNDNYCDKAMTTVGTPTTCTAGGGDCDDGNIYAYPSASEYCDGRDNNCDTKADTDATVSGPICTSAYGGTIIHGTLACAGANPVPDEYAPYTGAQNDGYECKITACTSPWTNLDGLDATGCECDTTDKWAFDNKAVVDAPNTCGATAVDLGTLYDAGSGMTVVVQGKVVSAADADWYKVRFEDSTSENSTGANSFSAWVHLDDTVGGMIALDVYDRGTATTCPTAAPVCDAGSGGGTGGALSNSNPDWMWTVKGRQGTKGESPCNNNVGKCPVATAGRCDTSCCDNTTDCQGSTANPAANCALSAYAATNAFCNTNTGGATTSYTRTVFIKVFATGTPTTCAPYQFTVSNNRLSVNQGF